LYKTPCDVSGAGSRIESGVADSNGYYKFRETDDYSCYRIYAMKENYFDDIAITIIVSKDQDWFHEQDNPLIYFQGVLIESVSNISFSNETENQIAEFTVNFKCVYPVVTR
jgi:hypothetical protein